MSKTTPLILALALLVGHAAACVEPPPPPEQAPAAAPVEETSVPTTPWTVRYADGSGNVTRLWQDAGDTVAHFETSPVTPETSSSGTYSGGAPRSGDLTVEQVDELWRRVREMESESSIHADSRTMGSGSFALVTPAGPADFLIQRCPRLATFDTFAAQLGGTP
jgi:hypothetical protein